jgi:leader peptidase (prepilin peptidase)/N-methyltransferase
MFFWIAAIFMLTGLSVSDLKSRTIPVLPVLLFAAAMGGVHVFSGDLPALRILAGIFAGTLPGLFLLAVSPASGSSIGTGDGIAVAACGAAIGFSSEFASLTAALLLCCAYSAVLLIQRKAGRKDTLPFLPFLAAGHILVFLMEVWI